MQISRKSEYAIHSLMILALNGEAEISVDELAMMQQISRTYLAKVMQKLANAGLVHSNKGFQGGYTLGQPSHQITLADVVSVFEGRGQFYQCLDKERGCQLDTNCLIHRAFSKGYQGMMAELKLVKISDLLLDMVHQHKQSSHHETTA